MFFTENWEKYNTNNELHYFGKLMKLKLMQLMEPIDHSYIQSKNIRGKMVSVYHELDEKLLELLRFKKIFNSFYLTYPYLTDEIYVSIHSKKIRNRSKGKYSGLDIKNFFALLRFLKVIGCTDIYIVAGSDIVENGLDKIIPIILGYIPSLGIKSSKFKANLLKDRFIKFGSK